MAGELITLDRQVELQGLLMGPGTPYQFEAFNPWAYPDLTANELDRPQRHGVLTGRDLFRARRISGTINIIAGGKQTAIDAMHELLGAWQPVQTDVPLVFRAGARTYRVNGRPRLAEPNAAKAPAGVITVEVRFLAADPFIYDNTEQTDDTGFPERSDLYDDQEGGDDYEDMYLDSLAHGRVTINNEGNTGAPWRAEFVGPWTRPTVQLLDGTLDYPPLVGALTVDVDLADGDVLTIDSNRELVHLNGAVRLDLSRLDLDWFTIPPGAWALRLDGDDGTGTGTAWTRSTWV